VADVCAPDAVTAETTVTFVLILPAAADPNW
jgi:hypothetical protein